MSTLKFQVTAGFFFFRNVSEFGGKNGWSTHRFVTTNGNIHAALAQKAKELGALFGDFSQADVREIRS